MPRKSPASQEHQESTVSWRLTTEDDLSECLQVQPGHFGDELTGPAIAHRVWKQLLGHPAFFSVVFECDPPVQGRRIIGFGAAVFVTQRFIDAELADPRPGLNSRLIASVHEGRPVLLTAAEIAEAPKRAGLDVLTLYGSWLGAILGPRENAQVQTLLPASLAKMLAGYRVHRMVGQAIGDEIAFMRKSGVVHEAGTFPEHNLVINVITSQIALAQPTSVIRECFNHRAPRLQLTRAEQLLLSAAVEGQTDADLATSLHLTVPAVKARWRSILARFARLKPEIAPEFDGEGIRGPQKRHRVLAYLREHPEELRPFAPDPSGDGV
jgi:hypothetical protein